MGLFSKPIKWAKKQTHGGLKKGLSASGLTSTFKGAIKNPIVQAGAGVALGGLGGLALSKLAPKIGGLFGGGAADAIEGVAGGDIASANPGRFRSILNKTGDFLGGKDGFGMDDVLKYGSAAGDAYGAYSGAKDEDRYRRLAEQEYARRAPLREAGMTALMDDSRPDLSNVFADPQNPHGRYRRVRVGSTG